MNITREKRKCFIPNEDFYSIPFKGAIGGKLVVSAKDKEEAKELLKRQISMENIRQEGK